MMIAAVCILISVACITAALLYRYSYRRLIRNIERMLDAAEKGNDTVELLDESLLSSIECRFSKYIASMKLSEQKANAQHETIREIVSNISHQTKTPIANILLYAELLHEEEMSDTARSYTQQLIAQSEKLSFLTASLVNLSRLENGIISQHFSHNAIMPMLETIRQQYCTAADEKHIRLVLEETDAEAFFDRKWMHEAIGNLVDNAIKYTDRGTVRIRTLIYEMFICIEIYDTGKGIAEEEYAKVFQRFYRSPCSAETEGLGIGLYITRQIVADTGGYVSLRSEMGSGSVFSVYLPRRNMPDASC